MNESIKSRKFGRSIYDSSFLRDIPVCRGVLNFVQSEEINEVEQVRIKKENVEDTPDKLKKVITFLAIEESKELVSKGEAYTKTYPIRDISDFLTYCKMLGKAYEKTRDLSNPVFRHKVQFVLLSETINHLAWGTYLAYQAAGARGRPRDIASTAMESLKKGLAEAAREFTSWFEGRGANLLSVTEPLGERGDYEFIADLYENGTRSKHGTYRRGREGCGELQNLFHAYKIRSEATHIDSVLGLFYGGITAAAIVGAVLDVPVDHLVYSAHEENFSRRDFDRHPVDKRIAEAPEKVLPTVGSRPLLVDDIVMTGTNLRGAVKYAREKGAENVSATTVELGTSRGVRNVEKRGVRFLKPTFEKTGMGPVNTMQQRAVSRLIRDVRLVEEATEGDLKSDPEKVNLIMPEVELCEEDYFEYVLEEADILKEQHPYN